MYIIHGGRASGKTTWLIMQSAMSDIPIMVTNPAMIIILKERAKHMGLKIPEPILWKKQREYCGDEVQEVIIDDVEYFIERVLMENNFRCVGMTCGEPIFDLTKVRIRIGDR